MKRSFYFQEKRLDIFNIIFSFAICTQLFICNKSIELVVVLLEMKRETKRHSCVWTRDRSTDSGGFGCLIDVMHLNSERSLCAWSTLATRQMTTRR